MSPEVKVLKYRTSEIPRQSGEVGRLRILKGAEVGATYVLKASSIIIGRGDEVDLVIKDLKASRSHARIDYTKDGWVVSDLGSANGIFFQGEYIRRFGLKSHEHFTIGETIFEFLVSHEETRILMAPIRDGHELARQDEALALKKVKIKNMSQPVKASAGANAKKSNPRTLVLLAIGAAAYFYLDQAPQNNSAKKPAKTAAAQTADEAERSLASYLPTGVTKEVEKTADQYYWQGFREYMKGNYLRAKDSFELALQVNPSHEKARHYLASAEKENQDEIKRLVTAAKKANLIGRSSDVRGNCETAIRHLQHDQASPEFEDCNELLKNLKAGGDT